MNVSTELGLLDLSEELFYLTRFDNIKQAHKRKPAKE